MIRPMLLSASLLALAPLSAEAALCIVDYETREVRAEVLPSDPWTIVVEQSGMLTDWYFASLDLTVMGTPYEKYGLTRQAEARDFAFHAFQGSVPVLKMPGDADIPEIVYVLVDPQQCEVQPYTITMALPAAPAGTNQFE